MKLVYSALLMMVAIGSDIREEMEAMVKILDASEANNHTEVLEYIQERKEALKTGNTEDEADIVDQLRHLLSFTKDLMTTGYSMDSTTDIV